MRLVAAMREAGGDLSPNATSLSAVERAVARNAQMGGAAATAANQVRAPRVRTCHSCSRGVATCEALCVIAVSSGLHSSHLPRTHQLVPVSLTAR